MQLKLIVPTSVRVPDHNELGISNEGNLVANAGTTSDPDYRNPVSLAKGLTDDCIVDAEGASILIPKIFDCLNIVDGINELGGIPVAGNKILHITVRNDKILLNKCTAGTCSIAGELRKGPEPSSKLKSDAAKLFEDYHDVIDRLWNASVEETFDIEDNLTDLISLNTLHNSYADEQGFYFSGTTVFDSIGFGKDQFGYLPDANEYFKEGDLVEVTILYTIPNKVDGFTFETDPMGYNEEQFILSMYEEDNMIAGTYTSESTNLGNIRMNGMPLILDCTIYKSEKVLMRFKSECQFKFDNIDLICTPDLLRIRSQGPTDYAIRNVRKIRATNNTRLLETRQSSNAFKMT